jgi:hypothetical protein
MNEFQLTDLLGIICAINVFVTISVNMYYGSLVASSYISWKAGILLIIAAFAPLILSFVGYAIVLTEYSKRLIVLQQFDLSLNDIFLLCISFVLAIWNLLVTSSQAIIFNFNKTEENQLYEDRIFNGMLFLLTEYISFQARKAFRNPPQSWYNDKQFFELNIRPEDIDCEFWKLIPLESAEDELGIKQWEFTQDHLKNFEHIFGRISIEEFYRKIHQKLNLTAFKILRFKNHKPLKVIYIPTSYFMEIVEAPVTHRKTEDLIIEGETSPGEKSKQ